MTKAKGGPDFICVGPHKTGTGWLHDTLSYHREIYPTIEKEIRYFTYLNDRNQSSLEMKVDRAKRGIKWLTYGRFKLFFKYPFKKEFTLNRSLWWRFLVYEIKFLFWPSTLSWYQGLLARPTGCLSGDTSPSYATMNTSSMRYLKKALPDVKIILFLREPVERIWSHTKMNLAVKKLTPSQVNIDMIMQKYTDHKRYERYPYHIVKDWIELMGKEQVFIGFYEELLTDPVNYFKRICRFLEISDDLDVALSKSIQPYRIGHLFMPPPSFKNTEELLNHRWKSSKLSIDMPLELQEQLIRKYIDQVIALDDFLPNNFTPIWLTKYDEVLTKPSCG